MSWLDLDLMRLDLPMTLETRRPGTSLVLVAGLLETDPPTDQRTVRPRDLGSRVPRNRETKESNALGVELPWNQHFWERGKVEVEGSTQQGIMAKPIRQGKLRVRG